MPYTLEQGELADKIERSVEHAIESGLRTFDLYLEGAIRAGTEDMGSAIV